MDDGSDYEGRRAALIAEINAAFDGVSREDGTTLHEAAAADGWKPEEEQRAARRLDAERRWQGVPDEDIRSCGSVLSFLDAKGFRYYLPAFMVCGLRRASDDPEGILHSCVFHLLHEPRKSLRKSEPASIAGKYNFTDAQRRAVARFLRFATGNDDGTAAADRPTLQAVEKWERYVRECGSGEGGL